MKKQTGHVQFFSLKLLEVFCSVVCSCPSAQWDSTREMSLDVRRFESRSRKKLFLSFVWRRNRKVDAVSGFSGFEVVALKCIFQKYMFRCPSCFFPLWDPFDKNFGVKNERNIEDALVLLQTDLFLRFSPILCLMRPSCGSRQDS